MKRFLAMTLFLFVLAGTLALSRAEDVTLLIKAGRKAREQVANVLPEGRKLAGPLAAFRAGDALPVEERVRIRIQTDKTMAGSDVSVIATKNAGEIRLSGIVLGADQRSRAMELANGTTGVSAVIEELAVPEDR